MLSATAAFLTRIGIKGAIIAALTLALAVQTVRIEGFKVWPFSVKGLKVKLADARAEIKRMNDEAKKVEVRGKQIAKDVKDRHDEEVRRIDRDAAVIRVSGPGKAVCPRLPASSGRQEPVSGSARPAVDQVPDGPRDDIIALPFAGTVGAGQVCDLNRAEVIAWREWYDRIVKEWPSRKATAAPAG